MSSIIEHIRRRADTNPSRIALAGDVCELSFAQLESRIDSYAEFLCDQDCQVIGLMADNSVGWIIADLAALASGKTLIPIPPYFTEAQARHLMLISDADTLIADEYFSRHSVVADFERQIGRIGHLNVFRADTTTPGNAQINNATAKITFTSGSSGAPKGVCLSHDVLNGVAERLKATFEDLAIGHHLCVMPLATLLENLAGVYAPLTLGSTVHVPSLGTLGLYGSSRIDADRFVQTIERTGAESLILQPALLRTLTASYVGNGRRSSSLKFVAVGGARVADADLAEAQALGIPAFQGYGLSECASVIALNRPGMYRAGSVGKPLPGIDVSIDQDGEILVSNQAMTGYLGDRTVAQDVVRTGDIGHLDSDGFLYVTGRKKDVFITSFGRNVSPEWPESELLHQPEIAQASVFGEAQPTNTAVIVPADGAQTEQSIANAIARANAELPDYAQIADWIIADEPFSVTNQLMTATGKVRREAVKARFVPGAAQPAQRTGRNRVGDRTANVV